MSMFGSEAPEELRVALAERERLIELCVYAMDRARSAGVTERLTEGLRGCGVSAVRPEGEWFDPARHEAGGIVTTDDPELDGLIAETEVVGFADRDRVLRAPIVTVYQFRSQQVRSQQVWSPQVRPQQVPTASGVGPRVPRPSVSGCQG